MACVPWSWHANDYGPAARQAQSAHTRNRECSRASQPQDPAHACRACMPAPASCCAARTRSPPPCSRTPAATLALTPAQFGVLTVLQAHPGLGQSSLARALGFDKVTVLRVLRGLEARGLVARGPAADNRRNVSVSAHGRWRASCCSRRRSPPSRPTSA